MQKLEQRLPPDADMDPDGTQAAIERYRREG
jgi:hypothetical protein